MFSCKSASLLGLALGATLAGSAWADVLKYQGKVTQGAETFTVFLNLNRPQPAKFPGQAFASGRIETTSPGSFYLLQSGSLKDGGSVAAKIYFSQASAASPVTTFSGRLSGAPGTPTSQIVANFNLRFSGQDYVGVPVTLTPVGLATTVPVVPVLEGTPTKICSIGNIGGVGNLPTAPSVFTQSKSFKVTGIRTYHWNFAKGASAGTVGLRDSAGKMYGPWSVKTSGGSGAQNVNWTCNPDATLPPGTYTVVDSNPATWSQNAQSGGRGFVEIDAIVAP